MHGRDDHENMPRVVVAHPLEGHEGESEAEEVLEDEEAGECLDGDVTWGGALASKPLAWGEGVVA